jgi:hypothetical protein
MTERRFVLIDFRDADDVMGNMRFYETGNTYDMPEHWPTLPRSGTSLPYSGPSIGNPRVSYVARRC